MIRSIMVDAARCTGCELCELACSYRKLNSFRIPKSRILVRRFAADGVAVPLLCVQCKDEPCVKECPVGAITRDPETLVTRIDPGRCKNRTPMVRCKVCVDSCPFHGIMIDPDHGPPLMCDLCDGDPECLRYCAFEAITGLDEHVERPVPDRRYYQALHDQVRGIWERRLNE